jgi:hypothetical protein
MRQTVGGARGRVNKQCVYKSKVADGARPRASECVGRSRRSSEAVEETVHNGRDQDLI